MTVFRVNRSWQSALLAVAALAITGLGSRTQNKAIHPVQPPAASLEQADTAPAAKDYPLAQEWFTELPQSGVPEAQARLGSLYYRRTGIPEDIAKAGYWYSLAKDEAKRGARIRLGYLHYYGRGVSRDHAESDGSYWQAAEQGHAVAHVNLGHRYFREEVLQGILPGRFAGTAWLQTKGMPARNPTSSTSIVWVLAGACPRFGFPIGRGYPGDVGGFGPGFLEVYRENRASILSCRNH